MARSVCLVLLLLGLGCRRDLDPAAELEDRLLAPCCWRQSLRDHDSPVSTRLRGEIESRIAAGESAGAIERDLIDRYGERIRALPRGRDPRWLIGLGASLAAVAGMLMVLRVARRRHHAPMMTLPPALDPDDLDRLEDELARVD